jgi:hypothetical protein
MNKDDCIKLIRETYEACGRYPKKSDFTEEQVSIIKSYFGPWPRALEACGIIPSKEEAREKKKIDKRIASKRKKTSYKINHKENIHKNYGGSEDGGLEQNGN